MAAVTITVHDYLTNAYNPSDTNTIVDSSTHLLSLDAEDIADLLINGVVAINSTNDLLSWSVAQWQAVPTGLGFDANDLKIVFDTGAHIADLDATDLGHLNTYGVTQINPSDGEATIDAAQYHALGGINIDQSSDVTLSDSGENLAGLTTAEFGAMEIKGIDIIDATDNVLNLTVEQVQSLGGVTLADGDLVTVVDTGANLAALSAEQITALGAAGVDAVDASDDVLNLTVAQGLAGDAAGIDLVFSDLVTIVDTGANISAASAEIMAGLHEAGFDAIDATDNAYSLSVDQAGALAETGITTAEDDTITLKDSGATLAGLTTGDIGALADFGIDAIDASDDAVSFNYQQLGALSETGIELTAGDVVTFSDTGGLIGELGADDFAGFVAQGVDIVDSSDNAAYNINVASANVFLNNAIAIAADDNVTLADTGSAIAGLSAADIGALAGKGVDHIDATDDAITLNLAQVDALGGITLASGDVVTVADTSANLEALSAEQIAAYGVAGVDIVDASDDVLHLTVAQGFAGFAAGIELTDTDVVTVLDTGANIADVSASDMANLGEDGFDLIDVSNDQLSLHVDQAQSLAASGIERTDVNDIFTVGDSEANIEALSGSDLADLASFGFDVIDSTNNVLNFNASQAAAFGGENGLVISSGDDVTLVDSAANIQALSSDDIARLAASGFDHIDSTDNVLSLTADQVTALGAITLASADVVTLADTGTAIQALTGAQFGALAAAGVDIIDASDNALALTVDQYSHLGGVALTGADTVTIRDTGANLATLDFSTLAAAKVDALDATDNVLSLTAAQALALGTVNLAAGDVVTLTDTAAHIEALTGVQLLSLSGKGVDVIDASDDVLSLTVNQFNNLGSITLTGADTVTISDSGAHLSGLNAGRIAAMNTAHVDVLDATDNAVSFSAAQVNAMGSIHFAAGDAVTLSDTGLAISGELGEGGVDISTLAAKGIDIIDASDNQLDLTVQQYASLGTVSLTADDFVTELDSGSLIAAQSIDTLSHLYSSGVDRIDASDDVLNLSVAKFLALDVFALSPPGSAHSPNIVADSILLSAGDDVTLVDTGTNLASLTAAQISDLDSQGVDHLDASNDLLTLSAAQFNALGDVGLTSADLVTISDKGNRLAGLDVSIMASQGVDRIDATDNQLTLNKNFVDALASGEIGLTAADTVTMKISPGALSSLTAGQLANYAAQGVDIVDSTTDVQTLTASQASAYANTGLKAAAADIVTVVDSSANVIANLGGLFGSLASSGIDQINLTDDAISLSVAQANGLGGVTFDASDLVTVADTSAAIQALTGDQIRALATAGVDILDASDNHLTLSIDQVGNAYAGHIEFAAADVVTLADTSANLEMANGEGFQILGAMGVDVIDATDNVLTLDLDQLGGIEDGGIKLTAGDVVTLADTGADLASLSPSDLAGFAALGVDKIDVTDNAISLTLNQYNGFTNHGFTFGDEDTVTINGTGKVNTITGGVEHDVINANAGNDIVDGGAGDDLIVGGAGSDRMTGGLGADTFKFNALTDSVVGSEDRITDLQNTDIIDLSKIDANNTVGGNQAFTLVSHFDNHAGELMIKYSAGTDQTVIKMDVNGDGVADSQIVVLGDHHDFTNFVL
jgi:Ca2+-binding RTX toxin-like protein